MTDASPPDAADAARTSPAPGGRTLEHSVSFKLTVIARQLRKRFDQDVEGLGITRSQWTVIAVVARSPGATQRLIAARLDMSEAAAGRLIDRLCTDGLLERRAREDDRRAHAVHMTDKARPLLDRLSAAGERAEARALRGIDEADLARLDHLLDAIYANIG